MHPDEAVDRDEAGGLITDRTVSVRRDEWRAGVGRESDDLLAREEPLELRIAGASIAVVMRTPGDDLDLARGFMLTERIVEAPAQIVAVRHCDRIEDPDAEDNVVNVVLAPEVTLDLARLRRHTFASSSCGVCGKATIAAATGCAPPLDDAMRITMTEICALPERLRAGQPTFDATGGLHGAALCRPDGTVLAIREDVGRHNAIDKLVGWAAQALPWPWSNLVLVVSGRTSFEVVQKALAARIAVIVAVSAPTSLAVELARASGVTLVGFVRGDRACVYAGAQRIAAP